MHFAKGMSVEFADKTTEGKSLNELVQEVVTNTEDIEAIVGFDVEIETGIVSYDSETHTYHYTDEIKAIFDTLSNSSGVICKLKGSTTLGIAVLRKGSQTPTAKCEVTTFTYSNITHYIANSSTDEVTSYNQYLKTYEADSGNQWDTTPTENSTKAVTSGGVFSFVKPIYCHPIRIMKTDAVTPYILRLTFLIFNNSETPFTLETFKQFVDNLKSATQGTGSLLTSGAGYDGTKKIIASFFFKSASNNYVLAGVDAATGLNDTIQDANFDVVIPQDVEFYDGVNRIN